VAVVDVRAPEALRPSVGTVRARELRDEAVVAAGAGDWLAAEVDGVGEQPRHRDVSAPIHGDPVAAIEARAAEALGPAMPAVRGEARDKGIVPAGARQVDAAEVDPPGEGPRHRDVAGAIRGDAVADGDAGVPEALRPEMRAAGGELRDEERDAA